jgi:hypothetical protein
MPTANQPKTENRKEPQRAIIYLSEPMPSALDEPRDALSIDQQTVLCRCAAKALQFEVIGEFIDARPDLARRPGLRQVMATARTKQADFLIVSSFERLADDYYDTVRIAWHLGRLGTVPVPALTGWDSLPEKARPSR